MRASRPLLNPENQKSLVLSLFMNAIGIMEQYGGPTQMARTLKIAAKYFNSGVPSNAHDPVFLRTSAAKCLFFPFDEWFEEYMKLEDFNGAASSNRMTMKKRNTIMPKWPYRLKKKYGQAGAQEEFEELHESSCSGGERYVEWQLVKEHIAMP